MPFIDQDRLRTAVIGCGSIGTRRAEQASIHSLTRLLLAIDVAHGPARRTAERFGSAWSTNWHIAVEDERINLVVVAVPNETAFEIAGAALRAGKHVLIESPVCGAAAQAEALAALARERSCTLKAGLNHRYHRGVRAAHKRLGAGAIGDLTGLRLLQRGAANAGFDTLADVAYWFAGMPQRAFASGEFALLDFEGACVASLHAARTPWRPAFGIEAYASAGAIVVDGLGEGGALERLTVVTRGDSGNPKIEDETFEGPDSSWALEWNDFVAAVYEGTPYWGTPQEALATWRIVDALAQSAREGVPVRV